jgi:hypothetical protein
MNIFKIIFIIFCISLSGCLEWANRTFSDDGSLSPAEYALSIESGYAVFIAPENYEVNDPIFFRSLRVAIAYNVVGEFAGLKNVRESLMTPIQDIRYGNWVSNDGSAPHLDVSSIHFGDVDTKKMYFDPNKWSLEVWNPWMYELLPQEDYEPQTVYFEAVFPSITSQSNGIAVAVDSGSSWVISTNEMLSGRKTPDYWCHLNDDLKKLDHCIPWSDIWFDEIKRSFICFAIHEKKAIKRPCPFGAMPSFGFDILNQSMNISAGY